jgi:hypothetical protein
MSCGTSKTFEGTLKYKYDSALHSENEDYNAEINAYSKREFGVFFEETHKNGSYFRNYEGTDSIGLDFQVYDNETSKKYTKYNNNDTLYWVNVSNRYDAHDFKIIASRENDTVIENEKLDYLKTEYYLPYHDVEYRMEEEYYYNESTAIDPEDYVNFKQYFLYETFKETEAIPFLYVKKSSSQSKSGELIEKTQIIKIKKKVVDLNSILNKIMGHPLKERI